MSDVSTVSMESPLNGVATPGNLSSNDYQQQHQQQQQDNGTAGNSTPNSDETAQPSDSSNLIINYIPPTVTQEELHRMFSQFGNIDSVKLIKDKITGQSLGYGFVKFTNNEEASKAIQVMNGQQLENKILKVAVARPSSSELRASNLYVSGIPPAYVREDLEKVFAPYGTITEVKILLDQQGNSRCSGFVRFETRPQAEAAMQYLNQVTLPGATQNLIVKFAENQQSASRRTPSAYGAMRRQPQPQRFNPMQPVNPMLIQPGFQPYQQDPAQMHQMNPQMPAAHAGICLFVYHLPPEADESLLYQLFGPFGAVISVKVMRDYATGKCKGFGFVNMLHYQEAHNAVLSLNGYKVGNKYLQVSFKQDKR